MANFIKLPLRMASEPGQSYTVVRVDDAYDVAIGDSGGGNTGDILKIYTTNLAGATNVQVIDITYYNGGGTPVNGIVTAQDLENFRDLISEANQNPASNPVFNLIGEATAADPDDYKVEITAVSFSAPL